MDEEMKDDRGFISPSNVTFFPNFRECGSRNDRCHVNLVEQDIKVDISLNVHCRIQPGSEVSSLGSKQQKREQGNAGETML